MLTLSPAELPGGRLVCSSLSEHDKAPEPLIPLQTNQQCKPQNLEEQSCSELAWEPAQTCLLPGGASEQTRIPQTPTQPAEGSVTPF